MHNPHIHVKLYNDAKLSVSKLLRQLAFVDRSYGLGLWSSDEIRGLWQHDLELMLYHGDLKRVALQLLDSEKSVLFEFGISFGGMQGASAACDTAQGIELPVLNRSRVFSHRMLVNRNGRSKEYEWQLQASWATAEKLRTRATDGFESEHARRITGGRQTAAFAITPDARHRLVVTNAGSKAFAFAKDIDLGAEGVYMERRFAPDAYRFRVGDRVTAIVVQTPRGLQARSIEPGWPPARDAG